MPRPRQCRRAQISTGLAMPAAVGDGLMLEIDEVLPIGGYVRWSAKSRRGLMFTRILPMAAAEEIAARCSLHPSWLAEIRAAHAAVDTTAA